MQCKECGVDLSHDKISDAIPLCHPCYIKVNTVNELDYDDTEGED
jgi:hypothetical protein